MKKIVLLLAILLAGFFMLVSCKHEPVLSVDLPPTISGPNNGVCFQSDVLPLFLSNCAKSSCHDATSHAGDYILDGYASILHKGLAPGYALNSKIYTVMFETGNDRMPPLPNTDLTAAQKSLIGKWINEGSRNTINCNISCDSSQFKYGANVSLIISFFCLGCHSGTTPSAGIDLSLYTVVNQVAVSGRLVGAVTHAPGYSAMPNGFNKLNDCQIAQIKKWVAAGALNN